MEEMSAFLERKLNRRFQTFDHDGDGYIEKYDFELSITHLADEFGLDPDDPARLRLHDLSQGLWQRLVTEADTDADGRISPDEYKIAFRQGLISTPTTFDDHYKPYLEAVLAVVDVNGDGQFDEDEYVRWTGVMFHLAEPQARESFRRLDGDDDGLVTVEQVLDAIHEYYFDEYPGSAGSWLLGPLDDLDDS